MPCTSPLEANISPDGGIKILSGKPGDRGRFQLPCGKCLDCLVERARQWSVRIMHEASLHRQNWFATLTFKVDPRTLDHRWFQLFMKRLRKRHGPVRYYMCGEYGERMDRPHFHACLFGLELSDTVVIRHAGNNKLYTSNEFAKSWDLGFHSLGELTKESAMYVAGYVTKKLEGANKPDHYTRCDTETGEIYELLPEYSKMSLNPGIAKSWIQKYVDDVYNYDHIVTDGKKGKAPRYYDKHLEETDPERLEAIKNQRRERAKIPTEDQTGIKRRVIARITRARLKLKKRTL